MSKTNPTTTLEVLAALLEKKEVVVESLDRLKRMEGITSDGRAKCNGIKFETGFGPSAYTNVIDQELNSLLITTAIDYYTMTLEGINNVLILAEKGIHKEVGATMLRLLKAQEVKDDQ